MKKLIFLLLYISVSQLSLSAQPELSKYLDNDLELKKLALEVKKAALTAKKTQIENGFDVTLSTGTASFSFNNDETDISFKPEIAITDTNLSNLSLSVTTSYETDNGVYNNTDTSVQLSIDLSSNASLTGQITNLKAQRALLESQRNLQDRLLEAESEFYTELKTLYTLASDIITAQKDMYEDQITLEEIKAKGYIPSSSKYRQAEMAVMSDKHTVDIKTNKLEHDCAVFASKCGIDYKNITGYREFLPESIPHMDAIDILSFEKESYSKIESANYNHKLAELERKADKNYSVSASAGYTIDNTNLTSYETDTIDAGIDITYKGLTLGSGVSFPVSDASSPVYSLSAVIKPNQFRTASLTEKINKYNQDEEAIEIQSAEEDYNTDVIDRQRELINIRWDNETYTNTYSLYKSLSDDNKKLYEQGIIKETEYLSAYANKELYRLNILISEIELIIYNNEIKLLFCRDTEIKE